MEDIILLFLTNKVNEVEEMEEMKYVVVNRDILKDPRLSAKEKGVYAVLAMTDGAKSAHKYFSDNPKDIRDVFDSLSDKGYLQAIKPKIEVKRVNSDFNYKEMDIPPGIPRELLFKWLDVRKKKNPKASREKETYERIIKDLLKLKMNNENLSEVLYCAFEGAWIRPYAVRHRTNQFVSNQSNNIHAAFSI